MLIVTVRSRTNSFLCFHPSYFSFSNTLIIFSWHLNVHTHIPPPSLHFKHILLQLILYLFCINSQQYRFVRHPSQPVMLFGNIKHCATPWLSRQRVLSRQDRPLYDQDARTACSFFMWKRGREGVAKSTWGSHCIERNDVYMFYNKFLWCVIKMKAWVRSCTVIRSLSD